MPKNQDPIYELKAKLTRLVFQLRTNTIPYNADIGLPQSSNEDCILFNNKIAKRKRIVLLTNGCRVATCTMCPLPNEGINSPSVTKAENIINQFESAFKNDDMDNYDLITIYNNGNFFSNAEILPQARKYIYQKISKSKCSALLVESLPHFINEQNIKEANAYLKNKTLAVSIGLQSSNDIIRELAINSTCNKISFEQAVKILKKYSYLVIPFLIIKAPFLTEQEAIEDVIASIKYLSSLNINDLVLCPTRIAPNTLLEVLYKKK